jgi:oligosaccharyltransferase complex subunit beta
LTITNTIEKGKQANMESIELRTIWYHGFYQVYSLDLVRLHNGKWVPFQPQDAQFEAIMLDPYIRQTMKPKGKSLVAKFKLPDHYGVFTFQVKYNRRGLSNVLATETVQVRPYRHDQYPRFINAANPYYLNIFSMMIGFFALTVVFLFYKEPNKKVKTE